MKGVLKFFSCTKNHDHDKRCKEEQLAQVVSLLVSPVHNCVIPHLIVDFVYWLGLAREADSCLGELRYRPC